MNPAFALLLLLVVALAGHVTGHGRLEEPPSRATAWRYGFKTPRNDQDNELYCGGFQNQLKHGGKCGVCGDPYQGPRQHEAGGKYATGTIVRSYREGTKMAVRVHLTANHKGWMEFRLCPNNNPKKAVTFECLNRNLLKIAGTDKTRFKVFQWMRIIDLDLQLPTDLECSQCVLQWKYHAGNSWGTDPVTGRGCVGCGPQEEFYGCSDVSIGNNAKPPTPPRRLPTPPRRLRTTPKPTRGTPRPTRATPRPTRATPPPRRTPPPARKTTPPARKTTPRRGGWCGLRCCAVGVWQKLANMDKWCEANCNRGYCPPSHCICR